MAKWVIAAGAMALIAACGGPGGETTTQAASVTVEVSDAFILEPAAGRDISMGGMVLTAAGGDAALVAASADFADTVELHTMSMEGDRMQMREVEQFTLTEGEAFALERGGDHLMFFGVEGLAPGDQHILQLTFDIPGEENLTLDISATVRGLEE